MLSAGAGLAALALAACPAPPSGTSATFAYTGAPQGFSVPAGVTQLAVAAEGAHGGQYGDSSRGGAAGGVDATLAVTPGECMTIYVGGYGGKSGAFGWGRGGAGGHISGDGSGHSGAGGGGASAVLRGAMRLVVAGGGGGGGGDGASQYGGGGGDGGVKPGAGHDAPRPYGGGGGRGGAARGPDGQAGDGNSEQAIGAGGGAGGGLNGGAGGTKGRRASGGGGGGGGRSAVGPGASAVTWFTSTRPCPYKKTPASCHGAVTLSWTARPVAAPPLVRVLSFDIDRAAGGGVPISVAPAARRVRLELLMGGERVARRVVQARAASVALVRLRPARAARRQLRRARFAPLKVRSVHAGRARVQSLMLH